ncbi:hypothetical protein GCM10023169_27580 [Georgenia halophila]|uniref:Luciferase-like domain-containing protein n=1 Tax=Georgenia halophila TaxID=620889 RepID=A0ABP8LFP5_9MICO
MTTYGFHASHEQTAPSRLLADVQAAERAGFDAAMSSDHITPWGERQGHSGFAFSWLGAALATTSFPIGSVNAPGQRYHPTLVAQATTTPAEMFPDRDWVALGSGQAMNEHVTGEPWPVTETRVRRLEECVDVVRVYDRPVEPVPLLACAITPPTAA